MLSERGAIWVLRILGTVDLVALFVVLLPDASLADIHERFGLGPMPDASIVQYLPRSASLLYALYGGLLWMISTDVRRYGPIAVYLGVGACVSSVGLLGIGLAAGLSTYWIALEGPGYAVVGVLLVLAGRSVKL